MQQQTQKWDGFGKAPFSWDGLLNQELINFASMGFEGAIENTAKIMFSCIDEDAVKNFAEMAIEKLGITERNARDAHRVLEEYWREYNPDYNPDNSGVVELTSNKVVYETGHNCRFCVKPIMALKNVEFYCSLRFKHNCFGNPVHVLLTQAVNPGLKWKLERFRQNRAEPCRYSIVLEDGELAN